MSYFENEKKDMKVRNKIFNEVCDFLIEHPEVLNLEFVKDSFWEASIECFEYDPENFFERQSYTIWYFLEEAIVEWFQNNPSLNCIDLWCDMEAADFWDCEIKNTYSSEEGLLLEHLKEANHFRDLHRTLVKALASV